MQYDKIIAELGKFKDDEGLLKMYARRGQCFTTTKFIAKLGKYQLKIINDVKRQKQDDPDDPDGDYTFTDGCGNISTALADVINEQFGVMRCSAYQVRLGGSKGILCYQPELGIYGEKMIELRPSQLKFQTQDLFLEVIRCSTYSQGYLNRQVILLLSNLGVPDKVFEKHLDNALKSLDVDAVISNLEKIYEKCSNRRKKSKQELAVELDLFFGPSKIFCQIFKLAMIKTFEHKLKEKES